MVDYPIKVETVSEEDSSRLELFIRFIFAIIWGIILGIWGIFVYMALGIHWLYILVFGKRLEVLNNFIAKFFRTMARFQGYMLLLTDERPPFKFE